MKVNINSETKEKVIAFSLSGIIIISFYAFIHNLNVINDTIKGLVGMVLPFILGFSLAFLLNSFVAIIETKWFKNAKFKAPTKRKIAVTIATISMLVGLVLFLVILGSQVYASVLTFTSNFQAYLVSSEAYFEDLVQNNQLFSDALVWVVDNAENIMNRVLTVIQQQAPTILGYSFQIVSSVVSMFVGIIVAVYIMLDREHFYLNAKQVTYAIFPKKQAEWLVDLTHLSSRMFKQFVVGKFIDSLIIGIICYIGMLILGLEFAVLISFIVGVTNMIPFFGPFIGAIPSVFILLITNPEQSLVFMVWILALQQFDGNILGPKILGDSLGLPKLWVLFAIIVGGAMFGIVGMFLGVPIFSVIYVLIKGEVHKRLAQKQIQL